MKIIYKFTQQVLYQNKQYTILKPSQLSVPKEAFIAKVINKDGSTSLHDLNREIKQDCTIEFLDFSNQDARRVFWHSSAHVLGAILSKFGAELEFGPSTENGFYYQCKLDKEIELDQLNQEIEQYLKQKKHLFEIQNISYDEALKLFNKNSYKLSKIKQTALQNYQIYKLDDFIDLCKGPHIDHTNRIYKLIINHSQPYQNSFRYQGIAFPNSKSYLEYQKQQECDHRHIGKHQHLFVFNKLAPGSAFFLPHGTKIYNKLIEMIRKEYRERGYQEVITPQLFHKDLWKQSGHLDKYAENIYMTHDNQMGLKPMNCPGHCLLYKTLQHSYKELPIRFADFGVLHRNEVHGTLTGLTRVRKFTQDDAHIFCTIEQIQQEIKNTLDFLSKVYGRFGFTWELTLSTRPDKYIGDLQIWDEAERQLRIALSDTPYTENPGDGAFYGPKIDVLIRDHNQKQHQCGTIQLDFNLPERFDLTYHHENDKFSRPVMIHRAILGSIERMMAILTEQYNGKWPFWLSPRQVMIIPVSEISKSYAKEIYDQLYKLGFEVELEDTEQTLGKRIRKGEMLHFNYILTIGVKEQESNTVDVRERGDNHKHQSMKLNEFINKINLL
ncbi:unnamed protein product [Paramecium primaurelia]|uniref:threonine--tRNA ligase n=1 Tax=Paramecium primaurelia TaxID=5886 RepID=A0A8S1LN27_PARPR|nr:unnamed protein product [Paramecium primaurelia]